MDHQDWVPLVIRGGKANESGTVEKQSSKPRPKDETEEALMARLKNASLSQSRAILQARQASGYSSQAKLAAASQGKLTSKRIQELESGKGRGITGPEKSILHRLIKVKL